MCLRKKLVTASGSNETEIGYDEHQAQRVFLEAIQTVVVSAFLVDTRHSGNVAYRSTERPNIWDLQGTFKGLAGELEN